MMRWNKISPYLWVILFAILSLGIERGALQAWSVHALGPALMLGVVVSVSLCQGPLWGVILGFFLGMCADAISGQGMGLAMTQLVVAAGLAGFPSLRRRADSWWMAPAVAGAGYGVMKFIEWMALYVMRIWIIPTWAMAYRALVSMVLTAACAFLIHWILYRKLQPPVQDEYMRHFRTYR